MAKKPLHLNDEQKRFIVIGLARFNTSKEMVDLVRQEYGIELTTANIFRYDPTSVNGQTLSADLRDLFFAERKAYMKLEENIPIAHRFVRLLRLEREYLAAPTADIRLKCIEQAAKETGGMYTNAKQLTLSGETTFLSSLIGDLTDEHQAAGGGSSS